MISYMRIDIKMDKRIFMFIGMILLVSFTLNFVFSEASWTGSCDTDIEWSEKYDEGNDCPSLEVSCPQWFFAEIMTQGAGTREDGNDTINLLQCKRVCQREGKCLDREGFDSDGFNPTSGVVRENGLVPYYYSGDVGCQEYPCHIRFSTSTHYSGEIKYSNEWSIESLNKMSVSENGEIVYFDGVIGSDEWGFGYRFGAVSAYGSIIYDSERGVINIEDGEISSFWSSLDCSGFVYGSDTGPTQGESCSRHITIGGSNVRLPEFSCSLSNEGRCVLNEGELTYRSNEGFSLVTSKPSNINDVEVSSNIGLSYAPPLLGGFETGDFWDGLADWPSFAEEGIQQAVRDLADVVGLSILSFLHITGMAVDESEGENTINEADSSLPIKAVLTKPFFQEDLVEYPKIKPDYYYVNNFPLRANTDPDSGMYLLGVNSTLKFYRGNKILDSDLDDDIIVGVIGGAVFVENRKDDLPLTEIISLGFVRNNAYLLYSDNNNFNIRANVLFDKTYDNTIPLEINPYILNLDGTIPSLDNLFMDSMNNQGKLIFKNNKEVFIIDKNIPVDKDGNIISQQSSDNPPSAGNVIKHIKGITGRITGFVTGNVPRDDFSRTFNWNDIDNKWIGIADKRT
jgi:hypothetical protein